MSLDVMIFLHCNSLGDRYDNLDDRDGGVP